MHKIVAALFLVACFFDITAQTGPGPSTPSIFLPGIISTQLNERDMAISPDGNDMYYTLMGPRNSISAIVHRARISNGTWSEPEVASFSGRYADLEPAFSPDGKKLFFSSNRPNGGTEPKDYDIWVTETRNQQWSEPENLGSIVNTKANEFYPSVALSGNLYFTAEHEGGIGKEDIYISQWKHGGFSKPIVLDSAINTVYWEFNAFVAPDESFIIFSSYGRKDDMGGGDLYISTRDTKGAWTPARNMTLLNSGQLDYCPYVTRDRKTLYFTSQRHQIPSFFSHVASYQALVDLFNGPVNGSDNIYRIDFDTVLRSLKN